MALRICRLAILIFVVTWLVGRGLVGDASLPKPKQEAEQKGIYLKPATMRSLPRQRKRES